MEASGNSGMTEAKGYRRQRDSRSGLQQVVHPDQKRPRRYRIDPDMLRQSFARFSIAEGIPSSDLQAQLGHASLATTDVYLKATPNHRREAYMWSGLSDWLK